MKQFVIIGLGRFGESIARYLSKKGKNVLAIDTSEKKINKIKNDVTHAVQADATDIDKLKELGVNNFDVAVISIGGDIHANVLATLNVNELEVPEVIVKAKNEQEEKLLMKIGADQVVNPEKDMGRKISFDVIHSNIFDYIEFAPNSSLIEISVSPDIIGKSLEELSWENIKVNIIAIKRDNKLNLNPGGLERIKEKDTLLVIGENDDLEKLQQQILG